jgi:hypothetical protein
MFALSPLVWPHYYVLSLFPALWLMAISPPKSPIVCWGAASIILSSGAWVELPLFKGTEQRALSYITIGWIPLWFGIQAIVTSRSQKLLALSEGHSKAIHASPAQNAGAGMDGTQDQRETVGACAEKGHN